MLQLIYPACFYPCEEKEGYTAVIPDLTGCVTEGRDLRDAIAMATDAASGWILDALEEGESIPEATVDISRLELEHKGGFINFIVLDIDEYAKKYGNKDVCKNCLIPAWLNTQAERSNVDFSSTLKNALMEQLKIG